MNMFVGVEKAYPQARIECPLDLGLPFLLDHLDRQRPRHHGKHGFSLAGESAPPPRQGPAHRCGQRPAPAERGQIAPLSGELSALRRQQEQERLLLDQLLTGYDRVNQSLQQNNYEQALAGLAAQRAFFDDRSVASLPAVQKRRTIEFFLIDSLGELIRSQVTQTTQSAQAAPALRRTPTPTRTPTRTPTP